MRASIPPALRGVASRDITSRGYSGAGAPSSAGAHGRGHPANLAQHRSGGEVRDNQVVIVVDLEIVVSTDVVSPVQERLTRLEPDAPYGDAAVTRQTVTRGAPVGLSVHQPTLSTDWRIRIQPCDNRHRRVRNQTCHRGSPSRPKTEQAAGSRPPVPRPSGARASKSCRTDPRPDLVRTQASRLARRIWRSGIPYFSSISPERTEAKWCRLGDAPLRHWRCRNRPSPNPAGAIHHMVYIMCGAPTPAIIASGTPSTPSGRVG